MSRLTHHVDIDQICSSMKEESCSSRVMKAWFEFGSHSKLKKNAIQQRADNLCKRVFDVWKTYAHIRNLLMRGLGIYKVSTTLFND